MGVWNRLAVLKVVGLSGCFNLIFFLNLQLQQNQLYKLNGEHLK